VLIFVFPIVFVFGIIWPDSDSISIYSFIKEFAFKEASVSKSKNPIVVFEAVDPADFIGEVRSNI